MTGKAASKKKAIIRIGLFFLGGAVGLNIISFLQKSAVGFDPFLWNSYFAPSIFGGLSFSLIGIYLMKRDRVEQRLRNTNENLEKMVNDRTEALSAANEKLRLEITERKDVEDTLKESESKMRSIFRAAPIGIGLVINRNIKEANACFCEITGYSREELIGQSARMVYPSDEEYEYVGVRKYKEIENKGTGALDTRFRRKDGKIIDVLLSSTPLDPGDLSAGVMFTALDITERKQMEERIRKSHRELELRVEERTSEIAKTNRILGEQAALLDLAHDAIFVRDMNGKIVYWNKGAEKTYGWMKNEAMGKTSEVLLNTEFPKSLKEIIDHVLEKGRWEGELTHTTRDKSSIVTESRWAIQRDEVGAPKGILEINRDVTVRKNAEKQAQSYMKKLEESNQALQDFAAVASHDMREPLRKVMTFGTLLKEKFDESTGPVGDEKGYLEKMLRSTDRMQTLLQSLLDYARITTKAEPFIETDLAAVVREVLSDLEIQIERSGGNVHTGNLPTVYADPTQMHQLFQNLIGNGIKFHRESEKPVVHISCATGNSDYLKILVEDNGIGFDEKHLDRLFSPFQRLHGKNSEYEGTGMGLAICKKIVERHGGELTAKSEPGKGTLFIVTLPIDSMVGSS